MSPSFVCPTCQKLHWQCECRQPVHPAPPAGAIQRYEIYFGDGDYEAHPKGDWVKYEDIAPLLRELDELRAGIQRALDLVSEAADLDETWMWAMNEMSEATNERFGEALKLLRDLLEPSGR